MVVTTQPLRRPLWPVSAVVFLLGQPADEIVRAAEAGELRFVFDIARPGARRRELRILRDCVLPGGEEPATLAEAIEKILPHRPLRGVELQMTLACSLQHVRDLDAAGLIKVERERLAPSGPNASRVYSRASVAAFLSARALGDPRWN